MSRGTGKVAVWTGETLNPYAAAVAGVLSSAGTQMDVELWSPRSDWSGLLPDDPAANDIPGVRFKSFEGPFSGRVGRVLRLARMLGNLGRSALEGRTVIITFIHPRQLKYPRWFSYLGLRCLLVLHNAGTDRNSNGRNPEEQRLLLRGEAIVHTPEQAAVVASDLPGVSVHVARHPAYLRCLAARRTRKELEAVVVAGRAARGVVEEQGWTSSATADAYRGVRVMRTVWAEDGAAAPIAGSEWVALFRDADAMIAPLQHVTASATVMEALVAGLPVFAADRPLQPMSPSIVVVQDAGVNELCDAAIETWPRVEVGNFEPTAWNAEAVREWAAAVDSEARP